MHIDKGEMKTQVMIFQVLEQWKEATMMGTAVDDGGVVPDGDAAVGSEEPIDPSNTSVDGRLKAKMEQRMKVVALESSHAVSESWNTRETQVTSAAGMSVASVFNLISQTLWSQATLNILYF